MNKYTYEALAFRQQKNAPIQVAFVARADELLNWSGVPRKSDELLTGFQRFRDERRISSEVVPFFQDDRNCSPTALIVALRKNSGLGSCVLANEDVPPGQVVRTSLVVELDMDALDTDRVFDFARDFVDGRLASTGVAGEAQAGLTDSEDGDDPDGDELDESSYGEGESGEENGDDVHLGSVTLSRMKELLDDATNRENAGFRSAIRDFVKPAFLIDGQHRAFAGGKLGIPFVVCGLYGAPWEEQVFQFTVVNLKPKRIPPSLITSIAALSLTKAEHGEVETRLRQAGVKMREVTIMSLVAYDDRSPFAEKIAMAVGDPRQSTDLLGYGAAKRIANVWYRATRASLTQISRQLFSTNNTSNARSRWREEKAWFELFVAFWGAVKGGYPDSLWRKSADSRLFIGAHLWALQEALLGEADGQMPSYWQVDNEAEYETKLEQLKGKLLEVVSTNLSFFPSELWSIDWAKSSQDTKQGRDDLVELFLRFIDKGKKGGVWKGWRNDPWFKPVD